MSKAWSKGSTAAWRRLRAAVLLRDHYRCQIQTPGICTTVATCVDHIVGKGKSERPEDLRAACRPCNSSRGSGTSSDPRPSGRW